MSEVGLAKLDKCLLIEDFLRSLPCQYVNMFVPVSYLSSGGGSGGGRLLFFPLFIFHMSNPQTRMNFVRWGSPEAVMKSTVVPPHTTTQCILDLRRAGGGFFFLKRQSYYVHSEGSSYWDDPGRTLMSVGLLKVGLLDSTVSRAFLACTWPI